MGTGVVGLIGVAGLAGAGKTTAVKQLSKITGGPIFYLGQSVLDELSRRGLPDTPDNERQARIELRGEKGPAALAIPYIDKVTESYRKGIPVLIDAIFMHEEFGLLASLLPSGSAHLLAIEASFDVRSIRLATRPLRPLSAEELLKRDKTELEVLGTGSVMAAAECTIRNEETLDELYRRLAEFVSCCD